MASIERTAYPRFKSALTARELEALYCPTEEDCAFVAAQTADPAQQLILLARLKCQQHLGYVPTVEEIPASIRLYLCQQLHLPATTAWTPETQISRHRQRLAIRAYLQISSYSHGGEQVVAQEIERAAYTMSRPADLINVAIEHLVVQRFNCRRSVP